MKSYQVVRTHVSPYQNKNFLTLEKSIIESFPSLKSRALESLGEEEIILVTNTHTQLSELPRGLLKKTKLIVHPNSGYDHFSGEHELWRNIPLIVGHTIRATAVAEYSLGAVFQGLLELPQHLSWQKERTWNRTLLKGTSVWVFGYGHIGKMIADTLAQLGMLVTVVDPFITNCPHKHFNKWQEGQIKDARVIISAMSLNPTSYHIFGDDFFNNLCHKIIFINGARGKLADENLLKNYLLSNQESFAFLDVFEQEPFGEEWLGFPQVWKTSHIAGVEKDLDQKILEFEKCVFHDYLNLNEENFLKKYEKELLQNKWIKGVLV